MQIMNYQNMSVLIQANHNTFGSARSSGLQFDNVIIAHGSLLYHLASDNGSIKDNNHILRNFQLILKDLESHQCFVNPDTLGGKTATDFQVLKKISKKPNRTSYIDGKTCVEGKISTDETFILQDASLCLVQKYEEDNISNEMFKILSFESQHHSSYEDLVIPVFLFLMIGTPKKYVFEKIVYSMMTLTKEIPIYAGLPIAVESTPFSNVAFFNSLSRGMVSKTLGPDQKGFLTDARLVSGCEGAPIYIFENGSKGTIIGIVVCTVSRSGEEWIGFSLGLSLKHLLQDVLELNTNDFIPFNKFELHKTSSLLDIDLLSSSVIFVRCQHKWGSGVVVDADLGVVLTCSHIVYHAQDSVQVIYKGKKYRSRVEYATPPSGPYDLAVLSVGKISGVRPLAMATSSPVVGEPVITVGYALSTEASVTANGNPTISQGCVSKVSSCGGPLQTTCCTQSGVSGGAVLRPPDQLIGIVVSNLRVGTSVLPLFSFAVSVDDFQTSIVQFIRSRDPTCLQSLSVKQNKVKMKWMLGDSKL